MRDFRKKGVLKFVGYLNDADHDFMGIAVFVEQAEFDHRVISTDIGFHMYHGIILQMFFNLLLKDK